MAVMAEQQQQQTDLWIFGYGSLIWKPPPHTQEAIPGFIRGYIRRFWQASEDHRGTPEAPGRVVTLIPREEWATMKDYHQTPEYDVTWGVVYKIDPRYRGKVQQDLDFREKNGYTIHNVDVYEHENAPKPRVRDAFVYIGTVENPQFVGPAQDAASLARHIFHSVGPSGPNKDYLYKLAHELQQLSPEVSSQEAS